MSPARAGGDDFALWKKILLGVILVLVAMCLISVPLLQYGSVSGEEFSPGRFRRQSYHYWEIPLVHFQVTPLKKQDETNDLEKHLIQKKLISPANEPQPRWDLVKLRRGDADAPPGDALILCRYLDQKDEEGKVIWLEWSKKNPELAKILWPAVAQAARRDLYILVPDLFHLAQGASGADDLKQKIARRLANQYEQLAQAEQRLGRHEWAAAWFAAALRYDPESASAAKGREMALEQAKRQGKALSGPAP